MCLINPYAIARQVHDLLNAIQEDVQFVFIQPTLEDRKLDSFSEALQEICGFELSLPTTWSLGR